MALEDAVATYLGGQPKMIGKDGTIDANVLSVEGNITAAVCWPGDVKFATNPKKIFR
jgi:hypothetical protein